MEIIELIIISLSLSMDAFSASICKGLTQQSINLKNGFIVGLYFGIMQALMPLLGYYLGYLFYDKISYIAYYLSFFMLLFIGISIIHDANKNIIDNDKLYFKDMFPLAIATSIDAFIVGITFSLLNVNLWLSISIIGVITFTLSFLGYIFGTFFGQKNQKISGIIGGLILIIIGLKILLEHLF